MGQNQYFRKFITISSILPYGKYGDSKVRGTPVGGGYNGVGYLSVDKNPNAKKFSVEQLPLLMKEAEKKSLLLASNLVKAISDFYAINGMNIKWGTLWYVSNTDEWLITVYGQRPR